MTHEDRAVDPPDAEHTAPLLPLDATGARYFETDQLKQRRELIQHLVKYSSQIILVVGEPGVGKTPFARQLALEAPPG